MNESSVDFAKKGRSATPTKPSLPQSTTFNGATPAQVQQLALQQVILPHAEPLIMPQKFYHDDPEWADIEPIAQDDGPHPLAAIAYTDEYSEAMGYLRAAMAKNEFSERVLGLTEHIIGLNAAHYTVWLYRAKTLETLNADLKQEIAWLNPTALSHLKNYQIWHHRQTIIEKLGSPEGESDFISTMLEQDTKNYHVWSYRQWLVQRFGLYTEEELNWTESMIEEDVRNNSAWNHRWFLVFGVPRDGREVDEYTVQREIAYVQEAIRKAPQNQSPWNYLRGIFKQTKRSTEDLKTFALEFANVNKPDDIFSSHALDVLADIYAEEQKKDEAKKALDLLATKFDPIRANYWNYRKVLLDQPEVAA